MKKKKSLPQRLCAAKRGVLTAAAVAAAGAAYCAYENNALKVERYAIERGLPEPLTIVGLADLHGKMFGPGGCRLRNKVEALAPDLIVLPGDTVSADRHGLGATARLLGRLSDLAPVVLIPGNHERRSRHMDKILSRFEESGARVLCDERCDLVLRGTPVRILGLAEPLAASRFDYVRAVAGTLRYPDNDDKLLALAREDGLRIVLTHFPELFAGIGDRSYRRFDFDLLIAGHAHGGQIRLPGVGGLFAPGQGFFPKFDAGRYGEGPTMILSRGLGNDSFVPRIANRPEISCITVV